MTTEATCIELDGNEYRRDDGARWGLVASGEHGEDWDVSPTLSAALDEIERLRSSLRSLTLDCESWRETAGRLQETVDRLRKTEDGVPILPGDTVWDDGERRMVTVVVIRLPRLLTPSRELEVFTDFPTIGKLFSTREAAEAARSKT